MCIDLSLFIEDKIDQEECLQIVLDNFECLNNTYKEMISLEEDTYPEVSWKAIKEFINENQAEFPERK